MNLDLFNFLEDNFDRIDHLVEKECLSSSPQYAILSANELKKSSEFLVDGFIDYLVTGMPDSLDNLFKFLSRRIAFEGTRHSDLLGMPLLLSLVIRRVLGEEYADSEDEETSKKFFKMLDDIEITANQATLRFLQIFDEYYQKKLEQRKYTFE